MSDLVEVALSFIDRTNSYSSSEALLKDFSEVIAQFGFKHFIMTGLPAYGDDVESLVVANYWPEDWTNRYRDQSYFANDPVSKFAFSSSRAYRWADAKAKLPITKVSAQIDDESAEHGLKDGLAVPMFDPNNWQAVVSIASDEAIIISDRNSAVLQIAATICHGHASALLKPSINPAKKLTPREIDILSWMAGGKTRWETAEILDLSEHTVKKHLENILAKLCVANTTQAVARAIHSRQITL